MIEATSDLLAKARSRVLQLTGTDPVSLYLPFSPGEVERLLQTSVPFQVAFAGFSGAVLANPPKDRWLTFLSYVSYTLSSFFADRPIPLLLFSPIALHPTGLLPGKMKKANGSLVTLLLAPLLNALN